MQVKTNVMRILDKADIPYKSYHYETSEVPSGTEVAAILNIDPAKVFKTLVTVSRSRKIYVFMIPAAEELDLKKAAAAVGEKSVEMLKSKDLLPATGYVHGGCSPIGMKKNYETTVHCTAQTFDTILFSAGKIGSQVEMTFEDLKKVIRLHEADVIC